MQPKKLKITYFLLPLMASFLAWSFLQPSGLLATFQNNLWAVNYLKRLTLSPGEAAPMPLSEPLPHAAILAARHALRSEQPEEARQLLDPLQKFSDSAVRGTQAEVIYALGSKAEALNIWEGLSDTILLERAAYQLAQAGDAQNALLANQSLYRLDPEKFTSSLAFSLISQAKLLEAAELLQSSRSAYPKSTYASDWLRYLADIYSRQQNWSAAEKLYLETVSENPTDQKAWRNLGLLYNSQLKQPEKAIECFQKMVSLSPEEPYGYELLAMAYEKTGNDGRALETWRHLLLVSPDSQSALQAIERLSTQLTPTP